MRASSRQTITCLTIYASWTERVLSLLCGGATVRSQHRVLSASANAAAGLTGLDAVAFVAASKEGASMLPRAPRVPTLLAADHYHQHRKHKVAIFGSDGTVSTEERTGLELGIAVRDMAMFGGTKQDAHYATINLRDGAILVRTELVRAILKRDSLVLFECRRPSLSERVGLSVLHSIQPRRGTLGMPFELRMLEALLDETVSYLEDKHRQLRMMSLAVQEDINQHVSSADIRRLLPLQKAVTALQYDIGETKQAIKEVADSDKRLALLCLSEDPNLAAAAAQGSRWSPHMAAAQRLLLAIDRRIRSLDSDVRELTEHLDSTREVWHMQLDAMRNRIIHLNLHLEFASIATMLSLVPATMFGMNLVSGLEDVPGLFYRVAGTSVAVGSSVYLGLVVYHSVVPMGIVRRRLADMTALQDLLSYHVDEVGDVITALRRRQQSNGRSITRESFAAIVDEALGMSTARGVGFHALSEDKMDVLYRVLDRNHDGRLDVQELAHAHKEAISASADSGGAMELHYPLTPASGQTHEERHL